MTIATCRSEDSHCTRNVSGEWLRLRRRGLDWHDRVGGEGRAARLRAGRMSLSNAMTDVLRCVAEEEPVFLCLDDNCGNVCGGGGCERTRRCGFECKRKDPDIGVT